MKKILWVTMFNNIGREDRSFDYYLNCFNHISNLDNLICFCDKNTEKYLDSKFDIEFYSDINELSVFFTDKFFIESEYKILQDISYRNKIPSYLNNTIQYNNPKYNLVNYSKYSAIKIASELYPNYTHYGWIDFGFARNESHKPPANIYFDNVPNDKIYISCFYKPYIDGNDKQLLYISELNTNENKTVTFNFNNWSFDNFIKNPLTIIKGNMSFIPKNLTHWLENEMIKSIKKQYEQNIVCGHDEPILLDILLNNQSLFETDTGPLWQNWGWI